MRCSGLSRVIAVVSLMLMVTVSSAAQSVMGRGKTGPVPDPVSLDVTGLFQAKFVSVGDDQPFGGVQPIEGFLGRTVPELARASNRGP